MWIAHYSPQCLRRRLFRQQTMSRRSPDTCCSPTSDTKHWKRCCCYIWIDPVRRRRGTRSRDSCPSAECTQTHGVKGQRDNNELWQLPTTRPLAFSAATRAATEETEEWEDDAGSYWRKSGGRSSKEFYVLKKNGPEVFNVRLCDPCDPWDSWAAPEMKENKIISLINVLEKQCKQQFASIFKQMRFSFPLNC